MMNKLHGLLLAAAIIAAPALAQAAAINITSPWPGPGNGVNGTGFVVGYAFQASADLQVTAFGSYDGGRDGLAAPAAVGLYTDAGALLASATVGSGIAGTLDGYFRFTSIAPLFLTAGTTYVLGSYSTDPAAFVNANYGGLVYTVDPLITLLGNRDLPGQSGLAYPSRSPSNRHQGSFGPNIQFTAVAVPEPASIALFTVALAGLGLARRRRMG